MKKLFLCLLLGMALALLGSSPSYAVSLTHDAVYYWQPGGTIVAQNFPTVTVWKVGYPLGWVSEDYWDITVSLIEVREKSKDNGVFEYTVRNDNFPVGIYSFHVPSCGIPSIIGHTEDSGWTFSMDANWFSWTTTDPVITGGSKDFAIQTYGSGGYAISTAGVDDTQEWYDGGGFWVVSHPQPVPEPATLSLIMGIGLMGFVRRVIRKKFTAQFLLPALAKRGDFA